MWCSSFARSEQDAAMTRSSLALALREGKPGQIEELSLRISALAARNQAEIMNAARRGVHWSRKDGVGGFSVTAVNLDRADPFACRTVESQLQSRVFEHCLFRAHLDPETRGSAAK